MHIVLQCYLPTIYITQQIQHQQTNINNFKYPLLETHSKNIKKKQSQKLGFIHKATNFAYVIAIVGQKWA